MINNNNNNIADLKLKNQANTNLMRWGDKLLAFFEAGVPHRCLDPRSLEFVFIKFPELLFFWIFFYFIFYSLFFIYFFFFVAFFLFLLFIYFHFFFLSFFLFFSFSLFLFFYFGISLHVSNLFNFSSPKWFTQIFVGSFSFNFIILSLLNH